MTEVRYDLLARVADVVERELERGHYSFSLDRWGCGTTACAIGLCVATGEFVNEGLSANRSYDNAVYFPVYENAYGHYALTAFFGLDVQTIGKFFYAGQYSISTGPVAAREVIRRIRSFIKENAPKPEVTVAVTAKELELV